MSDKCIIFDLDDTLYKEIDFVKSAYRFIGEQLSDYTKADVVYDSLITSFYNGRNAFEDLNHFLSISIPIPQYLNWYRGNFPNIQLSDETEFVLKHLHSHGWIIGIISDGRSLTQRNKINALGLNRFVDNENVIISEDFGSEKPSELNYRYFMNKYPNCNDFVYVGDNVRKDFITPNRLGWRTIGLKDNGENIHKYVETSPEYKPQKWISNMFDLIMSL